MNQCFCSLFLIANPPCYRDNKVCKLDLLLHTQLHNKKLQTAVQLHNHVCCDSEEGFKILLFFLILAYNLADTGKKELTRVAVVVFGF